MRSLAQALPSLDPAELVLRVLAAGALGGLVGLEREMSDQPAGFRTHMLVSLGAALFTLVGAYGVGAFFGGPANVNFDPTRVAAQVTTGIGFLGAGAIIRHGMSVRGLTTAAALWVTAAIGVAVGLGFWVGAIATTSVTVLALYGFKQLERRLLRRLKRGRYEFLVEASSAMKMSDLARRIEAHGGRMDSVKLDSDEDDSVRLIFQLSLKGRTTPQEICAALGEISGVANVEWSR